jgi:hypothetical protein
MNQMWEMMSFKLVSYLIHIELVHRLTQKKIQFFCVAGNIFVDNDVEELNIVLSSSGQAQVDEDDDNNEINIKDCDGGDDESIEEKEDNFD